ncbi:MAG: TolC family protein, partial [Bacteroidales bacterium]|nr:TolC family protein [Bacteroidales bacterium]
AGNNPGLQSTFNDYLAALEVVPQVKALPDPQVAFSYFIQPVETRLGPQEFKFSASQMFPWFGTLGARENAAIQMAKAKYEAFEETKSSLFNEVKASYYNLYFTHKAIEITIENLGILNTFRNIVLIKVEAGIVSAVDEYRIEIEIGDLENQLALLRDNFLVQTVMFSNLLNVSATGTIEFPLMLHTSELVYDKNSILDSIWAQNHQLLNLDYQIGSLKYRQDVAKKSGLPNMSVGLDYIMIGQGENNLAGKDAFVFPRIGITIPLYRNKYKAMVDEVIYLEASKQREKSDKENLLETIFENAYRDLRDAGRRMDLYRNQLSLAEISLQILEVEYATNSRDFEEILRMERLVLKYALEIEKARADNE